MLAIKLMDEATNERVSEMDRRKGEFVQRYKEKTTGLVSGTVNISVDRSGVRDKTNRDQSTLSRLFRWDVKGTEIR